MYICQMPEEIQEELRNEIIEQLKYLGIYELQYVENAMNSKLEDLEEVIDVNKYWEKMSNKLDDDLIL